MLNVRGKLSPYSYERRGSRWQGAIRESFRVYVKGSTSPARFDPDPHAL